MVVSALLLTLGTVLSACGSPSSDGTVPAGVTLTVTPPPSGGYVDGQKIDISVAANHYFAPFSSIKVIQCADPGGGASGLPKSVQTCDGNTIQANTISPHRDGSFSEQGYVIFRLPNAQLAEVSSGIPVCNSTHPCVLYIGENQEDFTKPKIFSSPFTVKS
jgi:hypothetical protein